MALFCPYLHQIEMSEVVIYIYIYMICERETVCRTGVRKLSLDGSALPQSIEYILYYVVLYIYIYMARRPTGSTGTRPAPGPPPARTPEDQARFSGSWLLSLCSFAAELGSKGAARCSRQRSVITSWNWSAFSCTCMLK